MENAYYFDLQLFADEADNANDEQMDVAPEAPEDSQPAEPVNEEPRPEELNGLPDDVAKAAIDLAKEQESNVVGEQRADDDSAGQTSVTKNVDGIAQPNQKIPYNRFKQEVDKRHELEEALNAYKAKFGDIDAQHQVPEQPIQQAQPMQEPVPPMPSTAQTPLINPESIKLINEAAQKQAMQMAGLTQDDIDAMDYMDDDDPKKQTYQYALDTAKANIRENVRNLMTQRQQATARFMQVHQQSVNDYNNFYREQTQDPHFNDIVNFATNDYFEKLSPAKQQTVAASYARIERNVASPAEIQLIMDYFREAKAAYSGKAHTSKSATKVKQASAMPRADYVNGTAGGDKAVTEATLKKMLDEHRFEDLPESYQKMLLSGRIG